jgi:prepilin signal peptidase PulO-like enzyme (type II secretory pathway)
MPYNRWVETQLSELMSILLCILFCICLIISAVPRRNKYLNYISGAILVLIFIVFKGVVRKAFSLNIIIIYSAVALFIILKIFFYLKKRASGSMGNSH